MKENKFYRKTWFAVLMIVIFFPVGIYLLFRYKHGPLGVRIGVTAIFALGIIGSIAFGGDTSTQTKEKAAAPVSATPKPAAQPKETTADKKKKEIDALTATFQTASADMVSKSKGVISDVNIAYNTNHFNVEVFVDEATWARSNESEKTSFATTVGTSIENALAPHDTFVDIVSATNKDVVASHKLFGGWKIKR